MKSRFLRRSSIPGADSIYPDEIFLDSKNLPQFETERFEGVLEKPISTKTFFFVAALYALLLAVFAGRAFGLQVISGEGYRERSEQNSLKHILIPAERGLIYDRNAVELAWNTSAGRIYIEKPGFGHLLGFIGHPTEEEEQLGSLHPDTLLGKEGVERRYERELGGRNGIQIAETDVSGSLVSENLLVTPKAGTPMTLSIDSDVQAKFYEVIRSLALDRGFSGGSGVIMDTDTGEILALTNFPEYDSTTLSRGEDTEAIEEYRLDLRKPFLNRAVQGLYTPGSIFKPFVAIGALDQGVIKPETEILANGFLSLPNPFDPEHPSIFRDWKVHGLVDMRNALAYSSNVYFFEVGGGFGTQKGIGIKNIERYARRFGFGEPAGLGFLGEPAGVIPSPEWKNKVTPGEPWRVGDTYNTSIGQYGFQVTPLQVVRAIAAIAENGRLVQPTVLLGGGTKVNADDKSVSIDVPSEFFEVVQEGMRRSALYGTAAGLNVETVEIAAKTGTAEIDPGKRYVNSWVTGFFPYENPRYAFVVVMERGPRDNYIGGVFAARQLFDWMGVYASEYFSSP